MRALIQLDIVRQILTAYSDDIPVHFFLKEFYKKHRQFGSRDRRFYSDVVYKYFRCKTLFDKLPFEEKLCYSGFITTPEPSDFYKYLIAVHNIALPLESYWSYSLSEKLELLEGAGKVSLLNYFPASENVDAALDSKPFLLSHFSQPEFFIRVPQKRVPEVVVMLNQQQVLFKQEGNSFAFESQFDLSKFLPESSFEVQDYSSQKTIELFTLKGKERIWDCCSGAGGKSLMLMEAYPELNLYCSDKRISILENLKIRFQKKGLEPKGVQVFDVVKNRSGLTFNNEMVREGYFDLILADVPCSGSGTWGRNPERLYQFKEAEVEVYSSIQRSVVANAIRYLKVGGQLIYITCSVYKQENAENLAYIRELGLELEHERYFIGYNRNADTMYGALLRKLRN